MTKMSTTRLAISLAAALGAFAITSGAQAQESPAPQITLNARGYDLSTPSGVAALTSQAHVAINAVCAEGLGNSLEDMAIVNSCKSREYAKADARIRQLRDRQNQLAQVDTARMAPTH